jgi:hypothetical protein
MKSRFVDKNSFPKPLGMLMILIFFGLISFVNLAFAKETPQTIYLEENIIDLTDNKVMDVSATPYEENL